MPGLNPSNLLARSITMGLRTDRCPVVSIRRMQKGCLWSAGYRVLTDQVAKWRAAKSRADCQSNIRSKGIHVQIDPGIPEIPNHKGQLRGTQMPRVLVVDDDPIVCMAIEIYLERHDFQVTIADGGEAGLRALEGSAFDLMVVDIFMPHMRGFESIRIFHERAPTVPLIAMSGYAFANLNSPAPDFLRMALELGASRCLRKPFTPVQLLTAINECLVEAQSRFPSVVQLR
jgi:CheY-like chemotaxis protein